MTKNRVVDAFHELFYNDKGTVLTSKWLGVPTLKMGLDIWVYQEILFDTRPDVVIECGTNAGGSALFLASMLELLGKGRVITIDIQDVPNRPKHHRIEYLLGSSVAPGVVQQVRSKIRDGEQVMVILDSDHSRSHVLAEMKTYGPLVTPGQYMIVEDTNVNGHPVLPTFGPGPAEAVAEFLPAHPEFKPDLAREKFHFTFNPGGYLKRCH